MTFNRKLTKEQCKTLGRDVGAYLTGNTDMNETTFLALIYFASQLKDDYELLSVFINSTGCQGLAELLELNYPNNFFVQILIEILKGYEQQN